jgi:hypothetical protein
MDKRLSRTCAVLGATMLALASPTATAAGETLRCGGKIVKAGMTMDEVRGYCGEPTSSSVEQVPVRSGNRVTGTTEMHHWTYRRGSGQKPATLKFDRETLVGISYE